jgi:hypothetical protein
MGIPQQFSSVQEEMDYLLEAMSEDDIPNNESDEGNNDGSDNMDVENAVIQVFCICHRSDVCVYCTGEFRNHRIAVQALGYDICQCSECESSRAFFSRFLNAISS